MQISVFIECTVVHENIQIGINKLAGIFYEYIILRMLYKTFKHILNIVVRFHYHDYNLLVLKEILIKFIYY